MKESTPFSRALEMIHRINLAMSLSPDERADEMRKIGPYKSRGHGGKHRSKNRLITGRWARDRSKYAPNVCQAEGHR